MTTSSPERSERDNELKALSERIKALQRELAQERKARQKAQELLETSQKQHLELFERETAARVETEAALKRLAESEQRYRFMGETIPFGVWWCNPQGEAEYVSPSFCELLDMTIEEQKKFGWTKRLVEEDREPMLNKWLHCCATGATWEHEHRIIDRHGKIHTVLSRGLPVRDPAGKIIAWVGVNLDLTARKAMEIELQKAKESAEAANQAKDQLFATISHELRTPLTLILGPAAKMLGRKDLPESQRRDLEVVQRNARTLLKHVNNLLDLSKMQVGKMQLHYCSLELAWLVRVVASLFESVAAENQVTYEVEVPPRQPAEADPDKIQRVVLNLLSNAFKFTPQGGKIKIRLEQQGQQALLTVEDSGPGIPPQERESVFERFRQLDTGETRRFGGTGLGLSIVKEFIKLHGGSVEVGEAPGGGARFEVKFPLKAPPGTPIRSQIEEIDSELGKQAMQELHPQDSPLPDTAEAGAVGSPLVLVVEDNPDMNTYISDVLSREYRVARAKNGRQGLEKAHMLRPDLIVSDIMMPEMSGEQMVRALRADPGFEFTPIVLLTAKADENLGNTLLRNAVQEYMHKPFSTDQLLAKVARLIAERRNNESERAKAYQLFTAVTENIRDAIFVKDLQSRYLFINQAGAQRLGKSCVQEVLGKGDQELLSADIAEAIRTRDREIIASGQLQTFEESRRGVDGQAHYFVTTKAPHRDNSGQIIGILGISYEITERKRAEETVRKLNATLENKVQERTEALREANSNLQTFTYTAAHDLRAPLRAIKSFAMIVAKNSQSQLDPLTFSYLERVIKSASQMEQLLNDLLEYSKVSQTHMTLAPTHLKAVITEALAFFEEEIHNKNALVDLTVPETTVLAHRASLLLLINNLLSNALKFIPKGTIPQIRLWSESRDGSVRLWIRDNGIGISKADQPQLFGLFQRLNSSQEYPGTGLGLAMVKKAAERMGGRVGVESEPGQGSTFWVELPLG